MVEYESASIYIRSATELCDKIARIDAIITALEDKALDAAANDDLMEYSLDDGQTKIKTVYRGVKSILNAIMGFEQLRQMYINRLNGRVVRLVDSKSFRTRNGRF
jgi:hypothetical protein